MRTLASALLFALALGFLACGKNHSGSAPVEPQVNDPLDTLPPDTVLVDTLPKGTLPPDFGSAGKSTVAGVDSDFDGLRDDLQIYIYNAYPDTALRKAHIQLAKAFQLLLVRSSEMWAVQASTVSLNLAIDCLYSLDPEKFGDRVDDIEGRMVNTSSRSKAYSQAGAFISGGNYSVSTVADNASSCEANP